MVSPSRRPPAATPTRWSKTNSQEAAPAGASSRRETGGNAPLRRAPRRHTFPVARTAQALTSPFSISSQRQKL
jgi:hypothetical protein